MKDCQCDRPGYCQRFKREMNARRHARCQRDARYRATMQHDMDANRKLPDGIWDNPTDEEQEALKQFKRQYNKLVPCVHLGKEKRRQICLTCQGRVQVKVFECVLHGECTIDKSVGVQVCQLCEDKEVAE